MSLWHNNCNSVYIDERFDYANNYLSPNKDSIVFADEMGVNCSMGASYGYSLVGTTPRKVVRLMRSKKYFIPAAMKKRDIKFYPTLITPFNGEWYAELNRKSLV